MCRVPGRKTITYLIARPAGEFEGGCEWRHLSERSHDYLAQLAKIER